MAMDSLQLTFRKIASCFGGIPDSYLVLDVETSGKSYKTDHIMQIGYCLVNGGKATHRNAIYLDWRDAYRNEPSKLDALEQDVARVYTEMTARGKACHVTWERVVQKGRPALTVLQDYYRWLSDLIARNCLLVMHNGYRFDCLFFDIHFQRWFGSTPGFFPPNSVADTGAMFKAQQLALAPQGDETLQRFCSRVTALPRKVKWSLMDTCVPVLGLDREHNLTASEAHDAGHDAYMTHLVFEKMRQYVLKPTEAIWPVISNY